MLLSLALGIIGQGHCAGSSLLFLLKEVGIHAFLKKELLPLFTQA